MNTILAGILALTVTIGIILAGWYLYLRFRFRKVIALRYQVIAPFISKLDRRETIHRAEVEVLVRDSLLRHAIYRALEAYGRLELFPADFLTIEKGAEGLLITWLEFPTELGEVPHEVEFFTTVSLDDILSLTYYVFRYRMRNGHWAAGNNWMFGVVGPYHPVSKPYDIPTRIYSRFNAANTTTAEAEARWVHDNVQNSSAALPGPQ